MERMPTVSSDYELIHFSDVLFFFELRNSLHQWLLGFCAPHLDFDFSDRLIGDSIFPAHSCLHVRFALRSPTPCARRAILSVDVSFPETSL